MATQAERNQGAGAYSTPGIDTKPDVRPAQIITVAPLVSFKTLQIDPPTAIYLAPGDKLQIAAINDDPAITQIVMAYRLLRAADGQVASSQLAMPIGSNRVLAVQQFEMLEGYLLSVNTAANSGTNRGRCFTQVAIVRGSNPGGGPNPMGYNQLISDYESRAHNPSWPVGEYLSSVEGAGATRTIIGTTPAAGVDINEVVPTSVRWRLKSFRARLITGAAVANRNVRFVLNDNVGTTFFLGGFNFSQVANTTFDYVIGIGLNFLSDPINFLEEGPLPDNLLFGGSTIKSNTVGIQAADTWISLGYQVEQWLEL